jgi:hypothetical protein
MLLNARDVVKLPEATKSFVVNAVSSSTSPALIAERAGALCLRTNSVLYVEEK